eukprot:s554_g34.t1
MVSFLCDAEGVHSVVLPEYEALRDRYKAAAVTPTAGELPLAPPEVRALNLLCVLGFQFEGRCASLEWRAELVRRLSLARPMHFAQVKLWAELFERLEHLKAKDKLSSKEQQLSEEARVQQAQDANVDTVKAKGIMFGGFKRVEGAALWRPPSSCFVAGAALVLETCRVAYLFVNRIVRAASSGENAQIVWQAWLFVRCDDK